MTTDPSGYSIAELCSTLEVSRSGFYDHARKAQRDRRGQDDVLAEQINVIFLDSQVCLFLSGQFANLYEASKEQPRDPRNPIR